MQFFPKMKTEINHGGVKSANFFNETPIETNRNYTCMNKPRIYLFFLLIIKYSYVTSQSLFHTQKTEPATQISA